MKKLIFLLLVSFTVIACYETKKPSPEIVGAEQDIVIADTTVYGKCADAGRYAVLLSTATGYTVEYIILADSDAVDKAVVGGLYKNDRLAIIAYRNADGENIARRVINLTTIMSKWSDGDRELDLSEGADWKMLNGNIIVDGDMFSVFDVTPDTLTLENNDGIFFFERVE